MRAKALTVGLVAGLIAMVGVHTGAQTPGSTERKLELSFDGKGLVTLVAQNVSASDIFAKWAQTGGTKIVNAERLPKGLLNVQFENVPETDLVYSLVRLSKAQNGGSMTSARLQDAPVTPSLLGMIYITPSSNPSTQYMSTSMSSGPLYPTTSPDDELPPVMPPSGAGPAAPAPPPPPQNRGPGVYVLPPVTTPPPGGRGGDPTTTPLPGSPTGGRGGGY